MEFLKKIFTAFTMIGSCAAGLFLIRDFIGLDKAVEPLIMHILVSVLLILFMSAFFIRELMSARKEKYANITPRIHSCAHKCKDLNTYLDTKAKELHTNNNLNYDELKSHTSKLLRLIMDDFTELFYVLTGTKCRACIKSIYEHEDKLYVFTLVRDSSSTDQCRDKDKNRQKNHEDKLTDNSDFNIIHSKGNASTGYYFCNNLSLRRGYNSSSPGYRDIEETDISILDRILFWLGIKKWSLPYYGTIVWPIRQRESIEVPIQESLCIAFLAIDSESRNVFEERWDTELGSAIADSIFHPLYTYTKLLNLENREVKNDK